MKIQDKLIIEDPSRNIETIGDLKALIATATSKKRSEQGKAAFKDLASGMLADLIPGGGSIKGAYDAVKTMYSLPDDKRTGTALDYMDVDDDVSAIVDDNVENSFIKAVSEEIEGMPDDKPLASVDMTTLLSRYISSRFNKRTVGGFQEGKRMKITKRQLRRIISENMAMRNMIQKSVQANADLYDEPSERAPRSRKRSDPITKADVVRGSFEGTTADRSELTDKLRQKIEKLIDQGYEKDIPSNWEDVLAVNDGDTLFALSKVVFPGMFGTIMRTLFPANESKKMKITKRQLRRIIKEGLLSEMKPADMSMHDAAEYYEQQRDSGRDDPEEPLMDLDDYDNLEDAIVIPIRNLLRSGYSKEMVVQALKNIVEDAL